MGQIKFCNESKKKSKIPKEVLIRFITADIKRIGRVRYQKEFNETEIEKILDTLSKNILSEKTNIISTAINEALDLKI